MRLFNTITQNKQNIKNNDAETIANIVSERLSGETTKIIEELKQCRELDYDELADAMVKAQKKYAEADSTISKMMSTLVGLAFYFISIIAMLLSPIVFIYAWWYTLTSGKLADIIQILLFLGFVSGLCSVVFVLGVALFRSAKELETEKDKQFIVAVFSAMMSFSAMVVALISIFK